MSETETQPVEDQPAPDAPEPDTQPDEVPAGVDPETGEVTDEAYFDSEDEGQRAAREREAELAAERQQADHEQAANEAEIERQQKSLDRATKAYLDKLRATLGEDLSGFQPCPMCADGWPGIRLPVMPAPENLAAIKVAIGEDPDPPLKGDTYSRPCDKCDGLGKVSTGSQVQGQKAAQCLDCGGKGWVAVGPERESAAAPQPNGAPPVPLAQPLAGDPPRTPEEDTLRQLGAIVVWPPKPPDMAKIGGL